ncbi:MAG: AAA family ATPase [Actinomycetota bacterium]|nr:AAA family ATPase [Actinomycetota bacterium]
MRGDLVEREQELAALREVLAGVGAGGGRVVLVEGPPGVGKSRLLAAAREQARAAGLPVLAAQGSDLQGQFSFGVALQLFEPRLATADRRERAWLFSGPAGLAGRLFDQSAAARRPGPGDALAYGLSCLAARLAAGEPGQRHSPGLVLIVDDAHWADDASMRFLLQLGGRTDELPVAVIAAVRTGELPVAPDVLDRLRTSVHAQLLRPAALSDQGVERLVRAALPQASPALWQACARVSGGNPFYLTELLAALQADRLAPLGDDAARVAAVVPDAVLRSVLLRMARLPAGCAALACAVAVFDSAPLRHAAALARLDPASAERAADALAASHFLRPGEPLSFTHPLIRSAVHADVPALAKARAHRRAADILAADGADPGAVAAHLLVCRPERDAEVVTMLRTAAARALEQGSPAVAVRFLERALVEPPPPEARTEVLVEAALALAAAEAPDAGERLTAALGLIADRERRAGVLHALSRLRFAQGNFAAAAEAAERGLDELGHTGALAGELDVVYVMAAVYCAPLHHRAQARLTPMLHATRAGRPPAEPALLAFAASRLAACSAEPHLIRSLALASLAADPLVDDAFHGVPVSFAVAALWMIEDFELAEGAVAAAFDAARQRTSLAGLTVASLWRAVLRCSQGQLADAACDAQQALDLPPSGPGGFVASAAVALATIHLERGELLAAAEAIHRGEQAGEDQLQYAYVLEARGRLAHQAGDPAAALADLLAAGDSLEQRFGISNPALLTWRPAAALAALATGDHELAARLAEESLQRARQVTLRRPLGAALRAVGLVVGAESGTRLLAEAVAVLEQCPARLDLAHALVDLGAAQRRTGERTQAREPLRRGLALAEHVGATPLAATARDELRAVGGRRRARSTDATTLTPTERRMAELAANGLSNPQIAHALHISVKTVEWHLTHAYRKLRITSRHYLHGALENQEPST